MVIFELDFFDATVDAAINIVYYKSNGAMKALTLGGF